MGGLNGKDDRIHWFLRQREATMGSPSTDDVEGMRQEKASRILPDQEVCRSEE
ncbi:J domain-containing protein 1, partial [Teratosphaeriaceae sp. CCFEE 6253]